ncbi:hypothetical protein DM01DRAFT_327191 [Hesseltinella vesiculosa]|uniref:Uncharacterized protein n=1 Tax=Hesseltinella vesiculosa TaxID=101127 RepID=A0A1X2GRB9_9FUNG|nr:hypothetical protein DM01DRAFT_327191 [Hesseltinella vesiculosa]
MAANAQLHSLLQTMQSRFATLHLRHDDLTVEHLAILFDPQQMPALQLQDQIMNAHYDVDDHTLMTAMQLQLAGQTPVPTGAINYYIRSWSIPVVTLGALLEFLSQQYEDLYTMDEVAPWIQFVNENQNQPTARFHMRDSRYLCCDRYVGMCTGPVRPIDRHLQDNRERPFGILGLFLQGLSTLDEAVFDAATVWVVGRAAWHQHPGDQRLVDVREQVLINFFGLDNLVNQQLGGLLPWYQPAAATLHAHAHDYPTSFATVFNNAGAPPNAVLAENIGVWMGRVEQVARDNARNTRLDEFPFTPAYRALVLRQATPLLTVNGYTLMATIGLDVTQDCLANATPFFSSGSYAGHVACTSISRMLGQPVSDTTIFTTFVDLFPWAGVVGTLDAGIQQLRDYLHLVCPLVCVSLSRTTTSVAMANFFHHVGLSSTLSFLDHVGLPQHTHYPTNQWVHDINNDAMPPSHATILIPHVHPGNQKHMSHSEALSRVMDLSWKVTLLVGELVVQHLQTSAGQQQDNGAIIHAVWPSIQPPTAAFYNDHLDPRLRLAYQALATAKADHQAFAQQRLTRVRNVTQVQQSFSETMRFASHRRIAQAGYATGAAFGAERHVQACMLWKTNHPDRHHHIAHHDRAAWMQWAMSLDEGASFYASSLRNTAFAMDSRHRNHNVLVRYAPAGAMDNTWMEDDGEVFAAHGRWNADMLTRLSPTHFSPANQQRRVMGRWQQVRPETLELGIYQHHPVVHNRAVYVSPSNPLRIYWRDGERNVDIHSNVPFSALQHFDEQHRTFTIQILSDGLGFTTPNGQPVLHNGSATVVPLLNMQAGGYGLEMMRMWRSERRRLGFDAPEPAMANVPRNQRRQCFKRNTRQATLDNFSMPIYPTDSIALLRQFLLQDRFANGGSFNTAPEDLVAFLSAEEREGRVQPLLSAFLDRHADHPCVSDWLMMCSNMAVHGPDLYRNVQFLRDNVSKRHIRRETNNGHIRTFQVISFGAPITERH